MSLVSIAQELMEKYFWHIMRITFFLYAGLLYGCGAGEHLVLLDIKGRVENQQGQPLANEKICVIHAENYFSSVEQKLEAIGWDVLTYSENKVTDSNGCFETGVGTSEPVAVIFLIPIDATPFIDPPIKFGLLLPDRKKGFELKYDWGRIEYKCIDLVERHISKEVFSDETGGLSFTIESKKDSVATWADRVAKITIEIKDKEQ
jgi:hypothetical protein